MNEVYQNNHWKDCLMKLELVPESKSLRIISKKMLKIFPLLFMKLQANFLSDRKRVRYVGSK